MENFFYSIGIDWKTMLLHTLNFVVLFIFIYKFFSKPLNQLLEERKRKIEEGLRLREETEEMIKKIQELRRKIINEAKIESEKIIKSANQRRDELMLKFEEEVANLRKDFEKNFEIEKEKIKNQFYQELKKELPRILEKFSSKIFAENKLNEAYIKQLIEKNFNE